MADVSLDEVIRRRGINLKVPVKRPPFGRGLGGDGKNFDARQIIGTSDVRQRLVKDAREKLVQKDARFKIQGRGGASAVQDARQMITSRKQGQTLSSIPAQTTLKAVISQQLQSKTLVPPIQIQTVSHFPGINFTTANNMLQSRVSLDAQHSAKPIHLRHTWSVFITPGRVCSFSQSGSVGSTFSMSAPITKVVKNDAYTAPRPPVPVAPTRPNASTAAARTSAAALQPPTFSPLEGTKITVNNLHPRVTEEDIVELFCVCGALKRARLVKVGVAEVVFVRKEDAVSAYRKYNNRCLDGQPMKCNLHIQGNVITSDQPILLRLSDTPGTGGSTKKDGLPPSLSRTGQRSSSQPTPEVDPQTILKALFKSTAQSTTTTTSDAPSSQTTAFRIKI
uniref:DNA polymerase delta interacting protein 3 n=1 Tax=Oryzias latipes TaxID=8090 RepID=H2MIS3_ORYLA